MVSVSDTANDNVPLVSICLYCAISRRSCEFDYHWWMRQALGRPPSTPGQAVQGWGEQRQSPTSYERLPDHKGQHLKFSTGEKQRLV